ncbi:thiol-disulfide oxidoreductase DCC family protein [Methylopila musalis]|uniref:Thiol-disulfide oxidoreductase DCC family protein n=1 Tax=Methylopila musalis TaxID=1134781 RepID=A0ABW3ZBL3_9HYPH
MSAAVVLYDGACGLCSRSVRFAQRRQRDRALSFVAMQSPEGRGLAARHGVDPDGPDTFLLIADGRAFERSDAALAVLRRLRGPVRGLRILRFAPKPLRDWLYDRVARNRRLFFGRETVCALPPADRP